MDRQIPCRATDLGQVRAQMPYGAHLDLPIHMAVIVLNKAMPSKGFSRTTGDLHLTSGLAAHA